MKIAFFDIETTDLKALMGRVLSCAILPLDGDEATVIRADDSKYKGRSKIDDSKVVKAIREELNKYNMVVGWNSKMFDVPFINARLSKHGEHPVEPQFHLDLMWYAKGASMRIGSARLDNVQKFLTPGNHAKTPISWEKWQLASTFDKEAMDEVIEHNVADVFVTRDVYHHLLPYVKNIHR